MAKNKLFLFILFISFFNLQAQDKAFYWVEFADKATSTHSVNNPETFLSQKSIDRRDRQSISVTEQDLPVPQSYLNAVKGFADIELHNTSRWMNAALIKTDNATSINSIKALSFVKQFDSIQPSGIKSEDPKEKFEKIDVTPKNNVQATFGNPIYGAAFNQIHLHNGEVLHQEGYQGENMTMAIIDAGFTGAQANLGLSSAFSNSQVLGVKNFIENSTDVYKSSTHGTYVFTTIAGNITGTYVGTSPNADYWLLMSEDVTSETIVEEYYWLFAAEYADSVGVDVINTSLGYTEFDDPTQNHTYADMDGNTTVAAKAADIAASKGMLLFNSNGNSGNNAWTYLGTPADADSVIAVGATDSLGFVASFSSLGPASDGDIKPNITGQGAPAALYHNDGFVTYGSGTSFSGPILSGLGTCLWQAFPNKTNMEIKDMIEQSSHIYTAPDEFYGYGIPDFAKAFGLLGGGDITSTNDFLIYPTLFDDRITLQISSNNINSIEIQLFDVLGKLFYESKFILEVNEPVNFINLEHLNLPKGIYNMVVSLDKGSRFTTKVVKR